VYQVLTTNPPTATVLTAQ